MSKPAEHHIPVTRTARYFTLGNPDENTKDIWILLHGHRQLAGKFIMNFSELEKNGSFLIAPEGLMRLYVKGDSGDVGASWMTKEDRESDIKDYVNYLDRLFFDEIEPKAKLHSLKINVLGFSQGSATLARWLCYGKARVNKAIFWCGSLAHDVEYQNYPQLKQIEIHQVFGSKDPYYDTNFTKQQSEIFAKSGITSKTFIFEGGHEINYDLMKSAGIV
jgi:predicted esterase